MASEQALASGIALERTKIFNLSDVTKYPLLQVQYIGTALFSTVAIDASTGDFTIAADDIDGETTDILTIDVSDAAFNTMGEVLDEINAQEDLRAFLIGCPRDLSSVDKFDTLAAASIRTTNGLTLFADEAKSGLLDQGFAITNQKFINRPSTGWNGKLVGMTTDDLCINTLNYISILLTVVGDGNMEVYACDDINKVEAGVLLWDDVYVTVVAEEHGNVLTPAEPFISAPVGNRLLIFFDNAAANSAATITAIGTTKHLTGARVPDANYTGIA